MKKTYHGSCHCGAVRFECEVDLTTETSRCNCSICAKTRFWKVIVGADEFRLLQGAEALADFQAPDGLVHHRFCRRCGVKPFGQGHAEALGGDFYGVNVACLDDATPAELAAAPVNYEDGAHDDYQSPPAETRYL